jgi:acetyl esterase/lipase
LADKFNHSINESMSHRKLLLPVSLVVRALLFAFACAAATQERNSRAILTDPSPPADHKIAYGSDPLQFGELRLPKGPTGKAPYPVVVFIHGGCWLSRYDLKYTGHLGAALAEAGVATWSIEYRRVGDAGGGWPGTFEDVANGVDYAQTLAKTYPLDLNRVVVAGHSAGGHLALWIAARKNLPKDHPLYPKNPLKLSGVVSIAGVADLRKTVAACGDAIEKLMGGAPSDQASRYSQASPVDLLPLGVKQIIVHGEIDKTVPLSMATEYAEAAKKRGDEVKLVVIEKAAHFEVVDPKSFAWARVRDEMLALLKAGEVLKNK